MTFRTLLNLTIAALIGLTCTACADDSDAGGEASDAGGEVSDAGGEVSDAGGEVSDASTDMPTTIEVDPATPVAQLTPDEVASLCREYRTVADDILPPAERLRFNCTVTGIYTPVFDGSATTDEELQEACVPLRDMCIDMGLQADDYICPVPEEADCQATLAEVETCFRDELQANAEFFATITCEEARVSQTGGMGLGDIVIPESCDTLYEQCPTLE